MLFLLLNSTAQYTFFNNVGMSIVVQMSDTLLPVSYVSFG
jgi:hypothetical protein